MQLILFSVIKMNVNGIAAVDQYIFRMLHQFFAVINCYSDSIIILPRDIVNEFKYRFCMYSFPKQFVYGNTK